MKNSEWAKGVYENFMESYDFARCQRPDGSFYGTSGKCRKGSPVGAKEEVKKKPKAKKAKTEAASAPKKAAEAAPAPKKAGPGDYAKGGKLKGAETDPSGADNSRTASLLRKRVKEAEERLKKDPDDDFTKDVIKKYKKDLEKFTAGEKVLKGVVKDAPKGTTVEVDPRGGIRTSFTTPGGNKVTTHFTRQQFNFQVNGSFDAGSVKGRQEEMAVARQVQRMWNAHKNHVPNGYVISTSAHTDDGKGASRQRAYERMGFSKAKPGGTIYTKIEDGKATPSNSQGEGLTGGMLSFKEAFSEEDNWRQAIFGTKKG